MRMKISVLIIFTLMLLSAFVVSFKKPIKIKNNIIRQQKNYLVYYNKVTDENINNISKYDMAILEPRNITSEQIKKIKKSNTRTYGYQSIFEVESSQKEMISLLNDEDYLYINGVKQFNEKYKCYYGDIRSQNYKDALFASIENNVIKEGFNGVFFDTLDDIEHHIDETIREELYLEYINFFNLLKSKYPKLSIIQNRAFLLFSFGSAEYLDGLMYEDLKYEELQNSDYYNELFDNLIDISTKYNVVILSLSHVNAEENYQLAKDLNWLYYFSPPENNYMKLENTIYNIEIKKSTSKF